jgi:hypothetical protein
VRLDERAVQAEHGRTLARTGGDENGDEQCCGVFVRLFVCRTGGASAKIRSFGNRQLGPSRRGKNCLFGLFCLLTK